MVESLLARWEGLEHVNREAIFRYLRGGELGVLERLERRSSNQIFLQTQLVRSLDPRTPDQRLIQVLAAEGCAFLLGPWLASWLEEEGSDEDFFGALGLTAPADLADVLRPLPRFYREGRLNSAGRFLVRMPAEVSAELDALLLPGLPDPPFLHVLRDELGEHPLIPPPEDPPEQCLTELLQEIRRGREVEPAWLDGLERYLETAAPDDLRPWALRVFPRPERLLPYVRLPHLGRFLVLVRAWDEFYRWLETQVRAESPGADGFGAALSQAGSEGGWAVQGWLPTVSATVLERRGQPTSLGRWVLQKPEEELAQLCDGVSDLAAFLIQYVGPHLFREPLRATSLLLETGKFRCLEPLLPGNLDLAREMARWRPGYSGAAVAAARERLFTDFRAWHVLLGELGRDAVPELAAIPAAHPFLRQVFGGSIELAPPSLGYRLAVAAVRTVDSVRRKARQLAWEMHDKLRPAEEGYFGPLRAARKAPPDLQGLGLEALETLCLDEDQQYYARRELQVRADGLGVSVAVLRDGSAPSFGLPRWVQGREVRLTPEFQVGYYNPEKRRVGTLPLTATPAERAEHQALWDLVHSAGRSQAARLERLLVERHRWPAAEWRERYLAHPLLRACAVRLVWGNADDTFRPLLDGSLVGATGLPYSLGESPIGLVHRLDLADPTEWLRHFQDCEVDFLFDQLTRECRLVPDRYREALAYREFRGALVRAPGDSPWKDAGDHFWRPFSGCRARLAVTRPGVSVLAGDLSWGDCPLGQLPPVVFSETVLEVERMTLGG